MNPELTGATVAAELAQNAEELRSLVRRVESEAASQPQRSPAGWSGPASWLCELALLFLNRELESAIDLLRQAKEFTEAAAWEAQHHG